MRTSTLYKSSLRGYTANIGDIWDIQTLTETYYIQRVNGANLKHEDIAAIQFETGAGAPVIPRIGANFQYPAGGLGSTLFELMICRSHQWSQPEGRGMQCTVNYSTRYFETNAAKGLASGATDIGSATALTRGYFLPCETLPVFMSRNIKLYRDNPSMTGPSPGLDISTADIGGSAKELDQDVAQVGLKVRMVVDAVSMPMVGTGSGNGIIDRISGNLGKKNSAAFLGYGVGNLVCTGATINHLEGEFYELAIEFLFDEYFHHSQIVKKATDGRPEQNGTNFLEVKWSRPVRGGADFHAIFPSSDVGKSQRYQAYAGRWW